MLGIINGIGTALALITFLGIVWWAFSRRRAKDNYEASMLPFALPDENSTENKDKERGSHE
ncbi:CcoQ/FixQ family Cbb3-type cytochrome c oxidase assembly chaperone [Alcaligenaceae bacterium]|nr:CcoQ/FixQ family Cbb3-type cytochrome c oxidase assembly chaperone [Alcaligenaceae bacterium]